MKQENKAEKLSMDFHDPVYKRFFSETLASPTTLYHQIPDTVKGIPVYQKNKMDLLINLETQLKPNHILRLIPDTGEILFEAKDLHLKTQIAPIDLTDCHFQRPAAFYLDILNPGLNSYLEKYVTQLSPSERTPLEQIAPLIPDRVFQHRLNNDQKEKFIRTGLLELKDNAVLSVDRQIGNLLFTPANRTKTHLLHHGEAAFKYDDEKIAREKTLQVAKQHVLSKSKINGLSM